MILPEGPEARAEAVAPLAASRAAAALPSRYPATWSGWAAIVLAAAMLAQLLLVTGDALPALYHVGPALIGVALLLD